MFAKIPVALFGYDLSPSAYKVYCAMSCCTAADGRASVRMGRLAQICNLSRTTVDRCIRELIALELIEKKNQYKTDGTYRACLYQLSRLAGRWIAVPCNSFTMQLPASAFVVYAAMLSFRGKNGRAFPSIRRLGIMVGLACGTVGAALKTLILAGLLRKARRWAGKHNLYLVALFEKKAKRKGAPACTTRNAQIIPLSNATFDTFIVSPVSMKVKWQTGQFLCLIWVCQNLYNKPIPTQLTKQKKELSKPIAESKPIECHSLRILRLARPPPPFFFFVPSKNAAAFCRVWYTNQKRSDCHESAIRRVLNEPRSPGCAIFPGQMQSTARRAATLSFRKPRYAGRMASAPGDGLSQPNKRTAAAPGTAHRG